MDKATSKKLANCNETLAKGLILNELDALINAITDFRRKAITAHNNPSIETSLINNLDHGLDTTIQILVETHESVSGTKGHPDHEDETTD